ncbi:MAG: AgmX/PglI C-terminal domain-containing protein [Candidatus Latescibacterota bacterium]
MKTRREQAGLARAAWLLGVAGLWACASLHPQPTQRASMLVPAAVQAQGCAAAPDGSLIWSRGDLQVVVQPMSDAELNRLFPEESSQGEYSINPYTFGDYVDPDVGYVRNRFTVFRVTVRNGEYAKVELDPLRALLTTDRRGEVVQAYGILAGAAPRTFEAYYRARRRPSGNEYYRFNMRMGIVRSNNYGVDEQVFKGESYGGFIVFDPLPDAVRQARLTLRNLVLKFSAFGVPLESVDLVFAFQRRLVESQAVALAATVERAPTVARLRAPSTVSGSAAGDVSRDPATLDEQIAARAAQVNECFAPEFLAGRAAEGTVDLRFAVDAEGRVGGAEVLHATVVSPAVGACLCRQVEAWGFGRTQIPVELWVGQDQDRADGYTVTVTSYLEFADARQD